MPYPPKTSFNSHFKRHSVESGFSIIPTESPVPHPDRRDSTVYILLQTYVETRTHFVQNKQKTFVTITFTRIVPLCVTNGIFLYYYLFPVTRRDNAYLKTAHAFGTENTHAKTAYEYCAALWRYLIATITPIIRSTGGGGGGVHRSAVCGVDFGRNDCSPGSRTIFVRKNTTLFESSRSTESLVRQPVHLKRFSVTYPKLRVRRVWYDTRRRLDLVFGYSYRPAQCFALCAISTEKQMFTHV